MLIVLRKHDIISHDGIQILVGVELGMKIKQMLEILLLDE
jgi:hypothetical protein